MLVIEVEVDKSFATRSALLLFVVLGEYFLIRKIRSWE